MFIILGSGGYIGSKFFEYLQINGDDVLGISRNDLDYYNPATLKSFLKSKNPRFLINAAGFTGKPNVDACESAKSDCLLGNSVLPGIIREVCEDLSIVWGHVSSGCIYSGRRKDGKGWSEEDIPNFTFRSPPSSFYSGSKALGEEVLQGASNAFVWRLRIPFNQEKNPRNYLQKLLNYKRLLEAENSISDLGEFVEKSIDCFQKEIEPGVYNMTNQGSITTRQVTNWMLEEGVTEKHFDFFKNEAEFMDQVAKTPRSKCVLDTNKAKKAGIGMKCVEEAMRESMRKIAERVLV